MFGVRIPDGLLIFLVIAIGVVIAIIWAARQDSLKRHQETVSAIKGATSVVPTPSRSTEERLAEIDSLMESGALSREEYEAKRKEILDTI